ncbi:MAG: hypothetical protein ACI8SI_000420 [Congregibacter sp.]
MVSVRAALGCLFFENHGIKVAHAPLKFCIKNGYLFTRGESALAGRITTIGTTARSAISGTAASSSALTGAWLPACGNLSLALSAASAAAHTTGNTRDAPGSAASAFNACTAGFCRGFTHSTPAGSYRLFVFHARECIAAARAIFKSWLTAASTVVAFGITAACGALGAITADTVTRFCACSSLAARCFASGLVTTLSASRNLCAWCLTCRELSHVARDIIATLEVAVCGSAFSGLLCRGAALGGGLT